MIYTKHMVSRNGWVAETVVRHKVRIGRLAETCGLAELKPGISCCTFLCLSQENMQLAETDDLY